MADKQLGLGALVKIDPVPTSSFTTQGLTVSIDPPKRSREKVDGTALADTLSTYELGIEEHSTFEFMQFWHPGDTNHQVVDTLFDNNTEADFQIIYPFENLVTDEFSGKVSGIAPETVAKNGVISRKVTVERTSAIARTTAP